MNEYICCKRLKGKCIVGDINIPYGTKLNQVNAYIAWGSKLICRIESNQAHNFFGLNTDGEGFRRFYLSHEIMNLLNRSYKDPKKYPEWYKLCDSRWGKIESDNICAKYRSKHIYDDWIWGHQFYVAPIKDLEYILDLILHVEV